MLITTGCTIDSISPAPVHPAPENIVLGAFEPVVVLDVTVEDDVWDIKFITVQFGTATESIVMERDLLVEVQDEKGETLHRFSKQDPRIVYFEEPPEFSKIKKMPKGKLLVSMPYSPEIQNVWLIGQSPTLKDLRESFDIGDEVKQAYEKFEEQIEMNPEEIPISTVPVIPSPPPLKKYTLAIYAGEGGTTYPLQGKYEFKEGDQVVVTAQPDLNWSFIAWEGDISSKATDITITMDSNKRVTARFIEKEYSLRTRVNNGYGRIIPSSGTFKAGTVVELDAIPDDFWKFDRWSGTNNNGIEPTTVTMTSDKLVTVYFTKFYSYKTQLIIARSSINTVEDLNGGKISVIGEASWDCAVVAQKIHGITCTRTTISSSEIYTALKMGVIDAVLVAGHPSMFVPEDVNVLQWRYDAIQAVMKAFPNMVATVLPAKTYSGQGADIYGYADKNKL